MRRRLLQVSFSASSLLLAAVVITAAVAEEDAAAATAEKLVEADFPKTAAVVAKGVGKNEARGKNRTGKIKVRLFVVKGCGKFVGLRRSEKSRVVMAWIGLWAGAGGTF